MRISQALHLWLLGCISILQVSTSVRNCPTSSKHNLGSKVSPSALALLSHAEDEGQLPKNSSVQSLQQKNPFCVFLILLLLILAALVFMIYRVGVSSAKEKAANERKAADQAAGELAQSHLKNETEKHEAEPTDIRSDDTVQWMWGDATMMSKLSTGSKGHSLARRDPLRWSRWNRLAATMIDLANRKDAQNSNRPVEIRTRRTKAILYFNSVDEALAALRPKVEVADILPDDTVQWMWGDANAMGHLAPGKGHSLAQRDPLRWSRWNGLDATISDLAKLKDARNANRPVKLRTRRSMVALHFETVDEALLTLREGALPPNPSFDSTADVKTRSLLDNAEAT